MAGTKKQPILIASSYDQFLSSVVYRLMCVAGIIYCGFHYEENPNVLGTLSVIIFIFFMLVGHEQIWVYDDKIIEKSDSIIGLIFKWKYREIIISDINKASLIPEEKTPTSEKVYLFILSVIFRTKPPRQTVHPVLFEMKNGETWFLKTDTGLSQRTKIVDTVNSLVERIKNRNK